MVESGGLENRWGFAPSAGSNPVLSAIIGWRIVWLIDDSDLRLFEIMMTDQLVHLSHPRPTA